MILRIAGTKAAINSPFTRLYKNRSYQTPRQDLGPSQKYGTNVPYKFDPSEQPKSEIDVHFIFGVVIYIDIFGRCWANHFCYWYDPDQKNRFIPNKHYNYEERVSSEQAALDSLTFQ